VSAPKLRVVTDPDAGAEQARIAAIVREAEALIREYDRRSKDYEHIALKQLRPLRDAVKGNMT
jgi:hypothetical protein